MLKYISGRYTQSQILNIFLVGLFPQHTWTMYMVFRDMSWIIEIYSLGQAISVMGYALLFALLESLALFMILLIFALLLPKNWNTNKRLALVYLSTYILIFWATASQFHALAGYRLPNLYANLIISSGHPLWVLYGTALVFTGLSILIPLVIWLKNPDFHDKVIRFMDRIVILSWLYLVFDLGGIVIVLYRNIF